MQRPIGMFDSGFGGLTVARALIDLLPTEDLVYIGDTGRYPYGPKPAAEVRSYAHQLAWSLVRDFDVKAVVAADMYSIGVSEEITGRAMRDFARRDDVVIATKVFNAMGPGPNDRGLSRKHVLSSIDASLRRLGTEYVDLYQIHRWDPETPIEETLSALDDIVRAGKARYIGASSMAAWQFATALHLSDRHGWARFVSMQNHYNLVYREEEREMLPLCRAEGIGVIPWSPLARGFLAGNRAAADVSRNGAATERAKTDDFAHRLYYEPSDFRVVERVVSVAGARGSKPAQVALSWLLRQPGVVAPIIGASKLEHLEDAVSALSVSLSDEEAKALEEPYEPHAVKM